MAKCKVQLSKTRARPVNGLPELLCEVLGKDCFPSDQVQDLIWMIARFSFLISTLNEVNQPDTFAIGN